MKQTELTELFTYCDLGLTQHTETELTLLYIYISLINRHSGGLCSPMSANKECQQILRNCSFSRLLTLCCENYF